MAGIIGIPHVIPHRIHINGNDAAEIQSRIRGATGQTANILEVQTVAGTTLFSVDNDGDVSITGNLDAVVNETLTGNITLAGNLTVNGNTTLGNAGTDTLTVAAASSFSGTVNFTNTLVSTSNGTFSGFVSSTVLNLPRRGARPATMGSTGRIYTFAGDADTTELWYRDAAGNDVQITDAGALEAASLFWDDDEYIRMGNVAATPDVRMGWNTTQTVDAWYFGTADGQNVFLIAENGDRAFDFAHGAQATPTVFIHSATQNTTQWLSLTHNATDAVITTGAGGIQFTQTAGTTGLTGFTFNIGAHTAITAATERIGINIPAVTQTWAAGAGPLANQRKFVLAANTYVGDAGGALTITLATSFSTQLPIAGANLTETVAAGIGVVAAVGGAGTITGTRGIFIEDQSLAGGATSYALNILSQTANATTTRAIEIAGTGVNNAIRLGSSPNIYSTGADTIRFSDATVANGFIFTLAATAIQSINTISGTNGEITFQNQTFTAGAAHSALSMRPFWASENFNHTAFDIIPTQNGANTEELRGLSITMTKATGATTLGEMIGILLAAPSVTGTVTDNVALSILAQGNAGIVNNRGILIGNVGNAASTLSFAIDIASQTASGTISRAIRIIGTGANNAIELGDSPLIYSSGVEVIRFDDSTAARGISFTLTAAGNQTIAATAGGLTLNNNRVGIGIAAGANSDVLIGASANDVAGYRMSVGYTDTSTTGTIRALNSEMTANPGAASDASYQSVSINTYTSVGLAQNLTGSLVGGAYFVENRLNAANTLTLAVGSSAGFTNTTGITTTAHGYRSIIVVTAGTVTNGAGFFVRPPTNAGTLVNMYGLDVSDVSLAGGTTAYGIRIQSQTANATTTRAIEIAGTGVNNAIRLGATVNLYANAANQLTVDTFNTTVFTQSVVTSGSPTGFTFTGGAHTTLAASTEATDVFLNLTRTVQFATGALTTQRAMIIGQPTYGFVAASTLSTAITAEVAGPPRAGTNATITNSYGLVVGRGSSVNPVDTASVAMLSVNMPDIANSVGAMTNLIGFELNSNAAQLGNQTATLDWFAGMHLLGVTLTSNTLVRTVADAGTLIVAGPPVASTNVTITNPARAVDIGGGAITTGTAQELRVRTGAHTGMTLSTEVPGVNFDLVATKQWATGALVTQRELVIAAPIYGFVGASTVTNASTVDINRPPRAGTNATITTAVALNLGGGGMDVNATNATQIGIFPLAIRDGYGAMTTLAGLYYTDGGLGIPLGDQTATLTNLNAIRLDAITYTSTTLVRTVTNPATLYIGGAPVASTNVTFSNTGLALHVDGGTSRFDGALAIDNDGTITLGSSTRYHLVDVEFGAENFEQVGWQLDVSQAGANSNGAVGLVIQMGRSGAGTTADMSGIRINAPTFGGTLTDASAIRIASQSNFANGDAIRLVGTGTANAITFATAGRLYANAGNTAIVVTGDLDAGGTRIFNGGIQANSQTLAANTNLTLDENDSQVLVTLGSTSDNTITLPAASGNEGMIIHVYVTDGAGTNNAVVTRAGVDTIANGSADLANTTITLQDTGDFVMLMCVNNAGTGDEWSIAAQSGVTVA